MQFALKGRAIRPESKSHAATTMVQISCRAQPLRGSCFRVQAGGDVMVAQALVGDEVSAAGVIGGRDDMSYFIVCPQQVGQLVAVKQRTSDGRTSMDLAHCVQTKVPLRISVSRALLIWDAPILRCRTAFNYGTRCRHRQTIRGAIETSKS
jgi:hypothetical protein